ncbi:hypothetical protein AB0L65_57225 [Nonomuraea sp. NPDC052116]|uniref:hypothetical protein n=1 Tax=Nonomuraea sp. NPDC052116 TaxID=3155665 RepID=UPI003439B04D
MQVMEAMRSLALLSRTSSGTMVNRVIPLGLPHGDDHLLAPEIAPRTDRDKEIEILVLRRQLTVQQRQVTKPTFTPTDRFLLGLSFPRSPDT